MRFTTVLAINAGAALGFLAAKQLLSSDSDEQIERLPAAARGPLRSARRYLERGQRRLALAWDEGRAERDEAEAELRREYYERTHPRPASPADGLDSLI
jgi:hypothetical protein